MQMALYQISPTSVTNLQKIVWGQKMVTQPTYTGHNRGTITLQLVNLERLPGPELRRFGDGRDDDPRLRTAKDVVCEITIQKTRIQKKPTRTFWHKEYVSGYGSPDTDVYRFFLRGEFVDVPLPIPDFIVKPVFAEQMNADKNEAVVEYWMLPPLPHQLPDVYPGYTWDMAVKVAEEYDIYVPCALRDFDLDNMQADETSGWLALPFEVTKYEDTNYHQYGVTVSDLKWSRNEEKFVRMRYRTFWAPDSRCAGLRAPPTTGKDTPQRPLSKIPDLSVFPRPIPAVPPEDTLTWLAIALKIVEREAEEKRLEREQQLRAQGDIRAAQLATNFREEVATRRRSRAPPVLSSSARSSEGPTTTITTTTTSPSATINWPALGVGVALSVIIVAVVAWVLLRKP